MIEVTASDPWTVAGHRSTSIGNLSFNLLIISCITDPVGDVIIPSLEGNYGIFFLNFWSNKPFA